MKDTCRFKSKRNEVFLRGGLVVKRRSGPAEAEAEAALLRGYRRAGAAVPRVLGVNGADIVMEYIPGETIPDFLECMEKSPDEGLLREAALGLCLWFEGFYGAVGGKEIRGDVNGRNFIVTPERAVISVDFEERAFGAPERDIGRLLAFIRAYDPPGTQAKRLFSRLFMDAAAERLGLSASEIIAQFRLELRDMKKRRGREPLCLQ